jgi:hypothetical protein
VHAELIFLLDQCDRLPRETPNEGESDVDANDAAADYQEVGGRRQLAASAFFLSARS